MRNNKDIQTLLLFSILLISIFMICLSCSKLGDNAESNKEWIFVSMPDFLNVDTVYPQPGWEEALDFILKSVKAENPDFLLVAGDLFATTASHPGGWW